MSVVKERYCQNKRINAINFKYNEVKFVMKSLSKINALANEKSYYPEKERKSLKVRKKELRKWLFQHKDLNMYYNCYGQDVVNCDCYDDYMPFYEFVKLRREQLRLTDVKNKSSYEVLLQDKAVFHNFFSSILDPKYLTTVIGNINAGKLILTRNLEEFEGKYLIVKPVADDSSSGVRKLLYKDGLLIENGVEYTVNEFVSHYSNVTALIELCQEQHKDLAALNTTSLNTIRFITIMNQDDFDIQILASSLRIGSSISSCTDNAGSGGLSVSLNESGVLSEIGKYYKQFGTITTVHPISGIVFAGYVVPMYDEVIALAKKAHSAIPQIKSIGWDIAISPNGPVLIEGNPDWAIQHIQMSCGPLKSKIYKLFQQ